MARARGDLSRLNNNCKAAVMMARAITDLVNSPKYTDWNSQVSVTISLTILT